MRNLNCPEVKSRGRGGEASVEPLIVALADLNPAVRRLAAQALGTIGDVRAVQPLMLAASDDDDGVRAHACVVRWSHDWVTAIIAASRRSMRARARAL